MDKQIEILNRRYNTTLETSSNKEFFLSVHKYCDYLEKNETLKKILIESYKEYTKLHQEVWDFGKECQTEEEADMKGNQTVKIETFNLFALYANIFVRVYERIEYYITTNNPDENQDPSVVILMRGLKYATNLKRWSKETLKSKYNWFANRDSYEKELRIFHSALLDELELLQSDKPEVPHQDEIVPVVQNEKYKISFIMNRSLLKINDKEISITLKNDPPVAHYVLEYIFENEEGLQAQSFYSEIIESKFPNSNKNNKSIYDACKDINNKVSKQANLPDFLIIKSGKSAYVEINPDYL